MACDGEEQCNIYLRVGFCVLHSECIVSEVHSTGDIQTLHMSYFFISYSPDHIIYIIHIIHIMLFQQTEYAR